MPHKKGRRRAPNPGSYARKKPRVAATTPTLNEHETQQVGILDDELEVEIIDPTSPPDITRNKETGLTASTNDETLIRWLGHGQGVEVHDTLEALRQKSIPPNPKKRAPYKPKSITQSVRTQQRHRQPEREEKEKARRMHLGDIKKMFSTSTV